jgi:hypothetical protein
VIELRLADGTDAEILSWLDDHSRCALHLSAHRRVTGTAVRDAFRAAVAEHGVPASTLTDNGMAFTTRLSGGRGGRNDLEHELRRLHVARKNPARTPRPPAARSSASSRPSRSGWAADPASPPPSPNSRDLLDTFTAEYNRHRPHRSLPHQATPATAYASRPKALPAEPRPRHPQPRPTRPHRRLRRRHPAPRRPPAPHRRRPNPRPDPRHSCSSRTSRSARPRTTGELLRELTLDLTRDYQPRNDEHREPLGSGVADVLRDHMGALGRIRTCNLLIRSQVRGVRGDAPASVSAGQGGAAVRRSSPSSDPVAVSWLYRAVRSCRDQGHDAGQLDPVLLTRLSGGQPVTEARRKKSIGRG